MGSSVTSYSRMLHHLPLSQSKLPFRSFRAQSPPPGLLPIHSLSLRTFVCRCFHKFLAMGLFSSSLFKLLFLAQRLKSVCLSVSLNEDFQNFSVFYSQHKSLIVQKTFFRGFLFVVVFVFCFCLDKLVLVHISMGEIGIGSILNGRQPAGLENCPP